jgi:hypothetical protein
MVIIFEPDYLDNILLIDNILSIGDTERSIFKSINLHNYNERTFIRKGEDSGKFGLGHYINFIRK